MSNFKSKALLAAVVGAVALAGCSTEKGAETQWPDYAKAEYKDKQKAYPNPAIFDKIKPSAARGQVYELLGSPHFTDLNIGHARSWDYVFRFRTPGVGADNETICQYKVIFNTRTDEVQSTYWHTAKPSGAQCPPEVSNQAPRVVSVNADALFGFDKAQLRPEAQQELDQVIANLGRLQNLTAIQVVGYTDPIGDAEYNQKLSQRRAVSVGQYLVQRGVPAQAIQAAGRGENDLKVQCKGKDSQAIACNAPNRRVEISIKGQAAGN